MTGSSAGYPPDIVAHLDQRLATLRTLVAWKRHHDSDCANYLCPGRDVGGVLTAADREPLVELAALAVCELARLEYAPPEDPAAEPTEETWQ